MTERLERSSRTRSRNPAGFMSSDELCWECSVCTYKNSNAQFKCDMCDTRKGTSTRPRSQQAAQTPTPSGSAGPSPSGLASSASSSSSSSSARPKDRDKLKMRKPFKPARLTNVDRSTAQHTAVTVKGVTVIITDYQPLKDEVPEDSTAKDRSAIKGSGGRKNKFKDSHPNHIPAKESLSKEGGNKESTSKRLHTPGDLPGPLAKVVKKESVSAKNVINGDKGV